MALKIRGAQTSSILGKDESRPRTHHLTIIFEYVEITTNTDKTLFDEGIKHSQWKSMKDRDER